MHQQPILFDKISFWGTHTQENPVGKNFQIQQIARE